VRRRRSKGLITNLKTLQEVNKMKIFMKRSAKKVIASLIGTLFLLIGIGTLLVVAQPKPPMPPPILKPDLVVRDILGRPGYPGIYGRSCPKCGCGKTDFQNHPLVEYQEDIIVHIFNQGVAPSAPCKLKIELYDVIGGRMHTIIKDVPRLEPGRGIEITEIGEFLYRKSTGIKATIDSTNVVAESDEDNNKKTVNECFLPPPG